MRRRTAWASSVAFTGGGQSADDNHKVVYVGTRWQSRRPRPAEHIDQTQTGQYRLIA
jgi:hypothetical protein